MDPLCKTSPSLRWASGEGRGLPGSREYQAHRGFDSESCLLTSLCISVAGLGVWEQAGVADGRDFL